MEPRQRRTLLAMLVALATGPVDWLVPAMFYEPCRGYRLGKSEAGPALAGAALGVGGDRPAARLAIVGCVAEPSRLTSPADFRRFPCGWL